MNDVTVPASVRPLLAHLHKLAVEQKRKGKLIRTYIMLGDKLQKQAHVAIENSIPGG